LAPLLYHNHEVERDDTLGMIARHNSQQEHPSDSNGLRVSSDDKFDFDSINSDISGVNLPTTDIISSLNTVGNSTSTGSKRRSFYCDSDSNNVTDADELEFLDCNMLQSSFKRVRLSRCPGEFRLLRDLKTLDPRKWLPENDNDENSYIHRATRARLTVVDSLRICLSLPTSTSGAAMTMTGCEHQRRLHSHHCNYQWKIMIQIPRMYPHHQPIVKKIEGLSIDHIIINELPPDKKPTLLLSSSSPTTTTAIIKTPVLSSLAQQDHHRTNEPSIDIAIGMKTIIWNEWSPIIGLGELLDFILEVAAANAKNINESTILLAGNNPSVDQRMSSYTTKKIFATTTAPHVTMSSSSCDSSVSSATSFSQARQLNSSGDLFFPPNTMTMTSDEITTNNVNNTISFLSPNRFDVGYGKFDTAGYEKYNNNPTSFAATTTTTTTTFISDNTTTSIATSCHGQSQQQYREKGEDEIEMDIC